MATGRRPIRSESAPAGIIEVAKAKKKTEITRVASAGAAPSSSPTEVSVGMGILPVKGAKAAAAPKSARGGVGWAWLIVAPGHVRVIRQGDATRSVWVHGTSSLLLRRAR